MKKVTCIILQIFVMLFTVSIFLVSCETTGTEDSSGQVGTTITWLGTLSEHPSSPELNYAYYNTTDGCTYIWDGDSWELLVQPTTITYVPKTGQTLSQSPGDDGDLEKGAAWPSPRFIDNGDGTVTDNLTDLIWLKNAGCLGSINWAQALSNCNGLASESCGLSDGSSAGDWRLPNVKELESLLDYSQYSPSLPSSHPFTGVQSGSYWSSTTYASNVSYAHYVSFFDGHINPNDKSNTCYVWPVRGGK
jgi:hypothetical protein